MQAIGSSRHRYWNGHWGMSYLCLRKSFVFEAAYHGQGHAIAEQKAKKKEGRQAEQQS
jgi:hypothetical protein